MLNFRTSIFKFDVKTSKHDLLERGLFALLIAGIAVGALNYAPRDSSFLGYMLPQHHESIRAAFLSFSLMPTLTVTLLLFLGFSALAQPFQLFAAFSYGIWLGFCGGHIYASQGNMIMLISFIPYAIISAFSVLLAAGEGFSLSCMIFSSAFAKGSCQLGKYLLKWLAILLLSPFSAIVYAILVRLTSTFA